MADGAIEVEGLKKRFGDVVALDGIDFSVPARSIFGLLGPNGAGKTTAVRILATVLEPDEGRATVLGHDVAADPDAVRRRIGLAGPVRGGRRQPDRTGEPAPDRTADPDGDAADHAASRGAARSVRPQ